MTTPSSAAPKNLFVIAGPAGSGKSTVGSYLSKELHTAYLEGDDYHTPANRAKMASGIPLSDADRQAWLVALRDAARAHITAAVQQVDPTSPTTLIVTCSALRRRHRDVFRALSSAHVQVRFIYLELDEGQMRARIAARRGHFMKEGMVRSQIECLEEPAPDEVDVMRVDVRRDRAAVLKDALARVRAVVQFAAGDSHGVDLYPLGTH